jgi:homoserine dehydrogenase
MGLSLRDVSIDEPAKRPQQRARLEPFPSICKVAILGFGTVGKAVAELLCCSPSLPLRLTHIYNRNVDRKRVPWIPSQVRWTDNFEEILASDVDVIVELVGGVRPAGDWVRRALHAGKSVVTANKHLIATEGDELLELARKTGQRLEYGASVAGGVPVLCGLEQGLAGEQLFRLTGVLNGTCNYILSKMENEAVSFAGALARAQEMGYAEANPSDDLGGFDASCKLAILARAGLSAQLHPQGVYSRSIEGVEAVDFEYARKLGCTIRQVSIAELKGTELYAAVQPTLVPLESPLAQTRDNQNVLITAGVHGGETVFAGCGAGGGPTSVAIVSDLVSISRGPSFTGSHNPPELKSYPLNLDLESPRYLRLSVREGANISDAVGRVLVDSGVYVRSVLQNSDSGSTGSVLVMILESCPISILEVALKRLQEFDNCLAPAVSLPIMS